MTYHCDVYVLVKRITRFFCKERKIVKRKKMVEKMVNEKLKKKKN